MYGRLRNDLYCVEWDVKLYYTIPDMYGDKPPSYSAHLVPSAQAGLRDVYRHGL